jgi:hypothetical protein
LRWMWLKLHLTSFTKFECTYREVNTESIYKRNMNGMMQCGTVWTGKVEVWIPVSWTSEMNQDFKDYAWLAQYRPTEIKDIPRCHRLA